MSLLVYVIIVVAIFALLEGVVMLVGEPAETKALTNSLKRKTLADDSAPWLANLLLSSPIRSFESLVIASGIEMPASGVLLVMAIITTATMVIAGLAIIYPLICLVIGIVCGVALPLLVISTLRKRRFAKVANQLPDALEMLVRSLRAGHPIPTGIKLIASEMSNPLGGEFRRVSDSMAYGLDLREALEKLTERLPVTELRYIVAAIRIQYATGGNLAEVLSSLSAVMRERKKLRLKVKALSAESKLSGNIMSLMPFLVVAALNYLNPAFYHDIHTKPVLVYILIGAATAVVVGIVMIRRAINIRV